MVNTVYLFYYLRSDAVHSKQKQSVRLREANWFPQSPTIVRIRTLYNSNVEFNVELFNI